MPHEFNQFHDLKIEYHYFAVLFKFLCTSTQNEYRSLTVELLNKMYIKTHTEAEKYLMQFKNSMFLDGMSAENSVFGAYYLASILKRRDDDDITVDPEQVANAIISNRIDHLLRFIDFNLNKDNADFDYQYFITPQKQHDLYNFAYNQMQKYIAKAVQNYTSENKTEMRTRDIAEQVLGKEDVDIYYDNTLKNEFNRLHSIKIGE